MLNDPLAVTYNSTALSLPRTSASKERTAYKSADGEFEVVISNFPLPRNGVVGKQIMLYRRLPDPTPSDVFDAYREIRNGFGFSYVFSSHRAETSVDVPRLRSALQSLVDTTLQGRIVAGEM